MFQIKTEWHQQRRTRGKSTTKKLSSETALHEWPDGVASYVKTFLEEHPRVSFSGMEDFGQGGCVMYPLSLRCRTYGDCRTHHIESVQEWVEKRVDELKEGESEDLVAGGTKWVAITITCVPKPEEPDEA
ncbi:hypothetical protein ACWEDZ_38395 [Streptomyces sp. NPDC005047]